MGPVGRAWMFLVDLVAEKCRSSKAPPSSECLHSRGVGEQTIVSIRLAMVKPKKSRVENGAGRSRRRAGSW